MRSENAAVSLERQAGERLVDQQDLRITRNRFGDLDLAQVSEGKGAGAPVEHAAQADARGNGARPLVGLRVGDEPHELVGQQRELDVFQHGLAMQRTRMLEHNAGAHARDPVRGPAGDLDAVDAHRSGIGAFDAHDQLHDRRFAGAVRADQAENLAGLDGKRHPLHGNQAAEALGEADTCRWAPGSVILTRLPWFA